jgi:DNA gyrase subunit A
MVRRRKNSKSNSELTEESRKRFVKVAASINEMSVSEWLKTNFIPYAWSYNLDRALVDVSGLKPVQRRILYTMFKRNLGPSGNRMKVATLAGAVLQFHPHGDSSVSEALKNMARDHVFRVPLIDGKGDFGAPGKPGAAGRYIEARLTKAAWINVEDLNKNAVKMIPNYDDTTVEPTRIPVKWPVGVINGGSGMAVAYASNIPSHNPTEIMNACIYLVKHPNAPHEKLSTIIQGPDFNMGGLVTSIDGVKEYLETGSGTFTLRAQYDEEPMSRGMTRLDFYEIPFGTYPEKILEAIQKQMEKGNLNDVSDYKDLSDLNHPVRVVVILKSGAQKKKVIEDLFQLTPLQTRFSVNMTTIVKNRPVQSSMRDILLDFIEFRKQCLKNSMTFDLKKMRDRLHLIDGLLKVLLDIDAAIKIIRGSNDADSARTKLEKKFKIDKDQADYVLSLQLRRLTRMDSVALKNEDKELKESVSNTESILNDEGKLNNALISEFRETLKVIGDDRHTEINGITEDQFKNQQKAEAKKIRAAGNGAKTWLYQNAEGKLVKTLTRIPASSEVKGKIDPIVSEAKITGNASIALIGSDGNAYAATAMSLEDDKKIDPSKIGILPDKVAYRGVVGDGDRTVLVVTRNGRVRNVKLPVDGKWDVKPVVNLDEGDSIVSVLDSTKAVKGSTVIMATRRGRVLRFPLDSLRPCGAGAQTVAGMNTKGDEVVIAIIARPDAENLVTTSTVTVKVTPLEEVTVHGKGGAGLPVHPMLPTDSITQIGVDAFLVNKGKMENLPSPTPRMKRPAPMRKFTRLSM